MAAKMTSHEAALALLTKAARMAEFDAARWRSPKDIARAIMAIEVPIHMGNETMSDHLRPAAEIRDIMKLWRKHGGSQHGPHVETITMPLDRFAGFLAEYDHARTPAPVTLHAGDFTEPGPVVVNTPPASALTPKRLAELKAEADCADAADCLAGVLPATLRALIAAAEERDAAYTYAKILCESYVHKYCSPVESWSVLPDLIGVLTQIDNATTVTADLRALLVRAGEAMARIAEPDGAMLNAASARQIATNILAEIRRATQGETT